MTPKRAAGKTGGQRPDRVFSRQARLFEEADYGGKITVNEHL
jgi:hypothetical protein